MDFIFVQDNHKKTKWEKFWDFISSNPQDTMEPIVDKAIKLYPHINYIKVDIDKNQEFAKKYNIKAIPTFLLLDDNGKVINTIVGAVSYAKLVWLIDKANK